MGPLTGSDHFSILSVNTIRLHSLSTIAEQQTRNTMLWGSVFPSGSMICLHLFCRHTTMHMHNATVSCWQFSGYCTDRCLAVGTHQETSQCASKKAKTNNLQSENSESFSTKLVCLRKNLLWRLTKKNTFEY